MNFSPACTLITMVFSPGIKIHNVIRNSCVISVDGSSTRCTLDFILLNITVNWRTFAITISRWVIIVLPTRPYALIVLKNSKRSFKKYDGILYGEHNKTYHPSDALSFYRKMFWAGPNFLSQTKNLFTYCTSHKHFVPDKKMICIQ